MKIALLLVLVLALAGCDLELTEIAQSPVESTPTSRTLPAQPSPTTLPAEAAPAASPTTAPSAPGAGGAPRKYTVQSGDTLSQIAEQFDLTTAELIEANNISSADFLQIGQVLIIPSAGATTGQVEPTRVVAAAEPTPTSQAIPAQPAATQVVEAAAPPTPTSPPVAEPQREPVVVNGRTYHAYNE